MKKVIKIVLLVILGIILLYAIFIAEESFRLSKDGEYPLIILNDKYCNKTGGLKETGTGYIVDCEGLGYRIKREYANMEHGSDVYFIISEEFWLFDKFLLWGWIS